jgi:HIV Tat-specific factor 1
MTNDVTDNPLTEHNAAAETPMNVRNEQTKKRKGEGETEVSDYWLHSLAIIDTAQSNKKPKVQENRAIYITGLPDDTNEVEIADVFKKYGVIDMGTDGKPRVKMYTDENGKFNGDALVVYFKKESISLAIQMMDDYYFRIEDQKHGTISVKEADMSYKRHKDTDKIVSKATRKDRKAAERNRNMLNQ